MLNAKVGQITQPTSTNASFTTTGLGFQPKIIFFWLNQNTANATSSNAQIIFGVAVSSADRRCVSDIYDNGVATTSYASGMDNTKCIVVLNSAATVLVAADFVSMDAAGFTLNFSTVDANARKIHYLALGGSDITNVKTGQFQTPGSTGNQASTDPGFKPDCLFIFGGRDTTSAPPNPSASTPRVRIGIATSPTQRGTTQHSGGYDVGGTKANAGTYQRTDRISVQTSAGEPDPITEGNVADLFSFDSTGFTLNWTVLTNASRYMFYAAIKGGQFKVGSFNQATSTGNQSVTTLGFQPSGIFLMSGNFTSSSSINNTAGRFSIGAATSSAARGSTWVGNTDGLATSVAKSDFDSTKVVKMITEAASPTVNAAADYVSNDGAGFTINNTAADATSREIIYLAFGNNANFSKSFNVNQSVNRAGTF